MNQDLIGWQTGSYSSLLAVCAIVLIPVFVWFVKHNVSTKTKMLGLYAFWLFGLGSLDLLGLYSTSMRFCLEGIALGIFLFMGSKKRLPHIFWLVSFVGIATISLLLQGSNSNFILYGLFLMQYLEIPLLFFAFLNARFSDREFNFITHLIYLLAISQIFASVIKFFLVGVCEPYIGTMSSHQGGITTIFSIAAFGSALVFYFLHHRKSYLWIAFGFAAFAMIGAKRASTFYIPLMYLITLVLCKYIFGKHFKASGYYIRGILLIPILFYLMARTNPSFNPEQKVWGKFDLEYILFYSDSYLSGEMASNELQDVVGRGSAFAVIHEEMLSHRFYQFLFGNGAGELIISGFNPNNQSAGGIADFTTQKYGVGYGLAAGYLQLLVQVGILGVTSYLLFFCCILFHLLSKVRKNNIADLQNQRDVMIALICVFSIVFIFIQYSNAPILLNATSFSLIWLIANGYRIGIRNLYISNGIRRI